MERQYQPQPITVPRQLEASSGRQLKQIVDNRPEFAAQAKMLGQLGVVQRWCPITATHRQTGGNCGLFCIRMAIETLAGTRPKPTPAAYDDAAEKHGSSVGEIFSIPTMENIIKELGYTATAAGFSNEPMLTTALGPAPTSPTLIGFSNHEYLSARGKTDTNPITTAGQRGHWSLIQDVDNTKHELTIINPNNPTTPETISISGMNDASQAISPLKGQTFDWATFIKGSAPTTIGTPMTKTMKGVDPSKTYTLDINGTGGVDVTGHTLSSKYSIAAVKQPVGIGGSIITIS